MGLKVWALLGSLGRMVWALWGLRFGLFWALWGFFRIWVKDLISLLLGAEGLGSLGLPGLGSALWG